MTPKEKLREKLNELQYQHLRETNVQKRYEIQSTVNNLQEIIKIIEEQEKKENPIYRYDH